MKTKVAAGLLATCLAASGCAGMGLGSRPAPLPEISAPVSRPPHIFPSAAIFPLPVKDSRKGEGAIFSFRLGDALLTEGFAASVLSDDRYPATAAEAAAFARENQADVAVTGRIEEFVTGGITTASHIRVSVEVIDALSGATLWRLVGTHSDAPVPPRDHYFYLARGRDAASPVLLSEAVAREMAKVLSGHPTPRREEPKAKLPEPETLAPRDAGAWRVK